VAAGGDLIRPIVTERVTRGVRDIGTSFESFDLPESLTPRELAVLRLMAGGFNNREIAQTSGTSEGTVRNQVSTILSKFGVRSRVRAVLKGIEKGYV
jgi:DNA-binding NarL/FixJ family response regulator